RRRTGHAAPRRTVRARLGAEGKAADRAAPALGGAGARRAGPLRAAWQGAGGADGAAARYARAGGARCAVPPGLDRPGRRRPAVRGTAAAISAGAAHETARTGAFPHLLLLLPGTDPADGSGLPRPRPGACLGPSRQPWLAQRLPPLEL